jgi:hypothetical protein
VLFLDRLLHHDSQIKAYPRGPARAGVAMLAAQIAAVASAGTTRLDVIMLAP